MPATPSLAGLAQGAFPDNGVEIKKWWRYAGVRSLNMRMALPMITQFAAGFDGSLFGGLQALSTWQTYFNFPTGSRLAVLGAAIIIGQFIASLTVSLLADRFGRKYTLWAGAFVVVLGGALQGGARNYAMFAAARAIIGLGSGWSGMIAGTWITEIAHPKQRATATALYSTSYALGSIIAAWITFGTYRIGNSGAWRIPSALQCGPSLIQVLLLWVVPESPRWLVSRGRNEEARQFLVKYHGEGRQDDPMVDWEMQEILSAVDAEKSLTQGVVAPIMECFSTPGNRKRMFIIGWLSIAAQACGNSFISYYFSPILTSIGLTSDFEQTIINATSQMLSWFSALAFALLPGIVGRKPLFMGSLVSMLAVVTMVTAGSAVYAGDATNKAASYVVVAGIYAFSPAYNLGMNGNLGLYLVEIMPFQTRATGYAFFSFCSNCIQLIFQFATPIGLQRLGWKYFIIHLPVVIMCFLVVYFFFPETKGIPLEEIEFLFDGRPAVLPHSGGAELEQEQMDLDDKFTNEKAHEEHVNRAV